MVAKYGRGVTGRMKPGARSTSGNSVKNSQIKFVKSIVGKRKSGLSDRELNLFKKFSSLKGTMSDRELNIFQEKMKKGKKPKK